jgi:hypothetical protein
MLRALWLATRHQHPCSWHCSYYEFWPTDINAKVDPDIVMNNPIIAGIHGDTGITGKADTMLVCRESNGCCENIPQENQYGITQGLHAVSEILGSACDYIS